MFLYKWCYWGNLVIPHFSSPNGSYSLGFIGTFRQFELNQDLQHSSNCALEIVPQQLHTYRYTVCIAYIFISQLEQINFLQLLHERKSNY